jgi:hypothetical protein
MAQRVLKAGTLRQGHRATVKRCANGCGRPAVARDLICGKDLCWFHLVLEHPFLVDGYMDDGTTYKIYVYYGP